MNPDVSYIPMTEEEIFNNEELMKIIEVFS